jgi:hypothetical protein
MRGVAPDARLARIERGAPIGDPSRDRVVDLRGVAGRAGAWRVVVRRVARRALRVRLGREHRTTGVARGARLDLRRFEVVRCVAAGARGMAGGLRRVGDAQRRWLLGVAARAALVGSGARFVDAMAVDATARAGVSGLLLGVALGARLGIERRRLVRAMAAHALLIGV